MAALAVYGGTVTAGGTDGNLIGFADGKILLSGYRDKNTNTQVLGLRAPGGASFPVVNLNITVGGAQSSWIKLSTDGANFHSSVHINYMVNANVLLYVKASIPDDADYGIINGNYINFSYLGGV